MAAKGRHSRFPSRKSTPRSTLVLALLIMFSFLVLILLALGILSIPSSSPDSAKANDLASIARNAVDRRSEGDEDTKDQWVEVISWEPRAFVYHNFLSKAECEHLMNLAKPHMKKSTVVDNATGKSKDSRVRTSSGTFLSRGGDKIIQNIEKRIADLTFIPIEHGEGLQVLHYEVGQKYEPHYDYFSDDFNTKNGGQRIATVLMYLSDVEEGGETVFPAAQGNYSSVPWWNELSECGKKGLSVKPKMGDALLFWSMKPDATPDPSSLHGGLRSISPYSGHYRPTEDSLDGLLSFLKENGVNIDEVEIRKANEDYENSEESKSSREEIASEFSTNLDSPDLDIPKQEEKDNSPVPTEAPETETKNNYTYRRTLSGGLKSPRAEVPKTAILERINSKKAARSYQLGYQLSRKWSTGAGPRIGCVADYPVELRLQALEFVNLSPRTPQTPSSYGLMAGLA